jgi:hypothetical protein
METNTQDHQIPLGGTLWLNRLNQVVYELLSCNKSYWDDSCFCFSLFSHTHGFGNVACTMEEFHSGYVHTENESILHK